LGALLGGIVTVVISRPSVRLSVVASSEMKMFKPSGEEVKFTSLRVDVSNKARQWTLLAPALRCRATITFYSLDGHNVFGRSMIGRWANLPAPSTTSVRVQDGMVLNFLDIDQFNRQSFIDIYPADKEPLDIAVRIDGDEECYAWSNEAYVAALGRNQNWRLSQGVYLVKVMISVSGKPDVFYFRLHNKGERNTFRLDHASKDEIKKIEAAQRST
jgi:hypothetical protein